MDMIFNLSLRRLAIGSIIFFLVAQIFQFSLKFILPIQTDELAIILQKSSALNRIRYILILLSMFGLIISFLVVCIKQYQQFPFLSAAAYIFFFLFCFFEIGYRSIEYFMVIDKWVPSIAANSDAAFKQAMIAKINDFNSLVRAIYFPLLMCHLLGSVFLLLTTFSKEKAVFFLQGAMIINAVRLLGRMSSNYLDFKSLNFINDQLYFPLISIVFLLQIVFLVQSKNENSQGALTR